MAAVVRFESPPGNGFHHWRIRSGIRALTVRNSCAPGDAGTAGFVCPSNAAEQMRARASACLNPKPGHQDRASQAGKKNQMTFKKGLGAEFPHSLHGCLAALARLHTAQN